jgi:hypothetical protein
MIPTLAVHEWHVRILHPSIHSGMSPPPAFPPIPQMPHIELPHTVRWSPMGASFTTKVMGDGQCLCQQGSDSGIGVLHISIPPTNPELVLTIATSACKWVMSSGAVLGDGKPLVGWFPILCPYLFCGKPVPLPMWWAVPLPCTVIISMSLVDLLVGWARILAAMAIAHLFNRLMDTGAGKWLSRRLNVIGGRIGQRLGARIASRFSSRAARSLAYKFPVMFMQTAVQDTFKGLTVSLVASGKFEAPFQLGEYNPWDGSAKVLTTELDPGDGSQNVSVAGGINAMGKPSVPPAASTPASNPNMCLADGVPHAQ